MYKSNYSVKEDRMVLN